MVRLCAALALVFGSTASHAPAISVPDLIARYDRAMTDPGTAAADRFEIEGTVAGAGLTGAFHSWQDGTKTRFDQNLGLRREQTIRLGERYFFVNSTGNVHEYHGSLLRRSRTQDLIDSGNLARVPNCCRFAGTATIRGQEAYELVVTADGGDSESLYLDAKSAVPLRLAYEEDDGLTTVDFSDWRSIDGRRFAFENVSSDGNHPFDVTQVTTAVHLDPTIDPSVFTVPSGRQIEMTAPDHVDLVEHDSHLFAPVTIAGHVYTFLIDTGAQSILLDERVAHELDLREEGALEASGAERTGGLHLARVDALQIGAGAMRDLLVTTIDLGASTNGAFRIDGILGYPFFASAMVRLDCSRKTMDFGPPGSMTPVGERVDVDLDRGLVELDATANGVQAPFILDTGNAAGVLLYGPFVQKHRGIVPLTLESGRSYGLGGAADSYHSLLDRFRVGATVLSNVDADVMLSTQGAFADRLDAGNIGLGLLSKLVLTFDDTHDALYLAKSGALDAQNRTR